MAEGQSDYLNAVAAELKHFETTAFGSTRGRAARGPLRHGEANALCLTLLNLARGVEAEHRMMTGRAVGPGGPDGESDHDWTSDPTATVSWNGDRYEKTVEGRDELHTAITKLCFAGSPERRSLWRRAGDKDDRKVEIRWRLRLADEPAETAPQWYIEFVLLPGIHCPMTGTEQLRRYAAGDQRGETVATGPLTTTIVESSADILAVGGALDE